MTAPTTGGQLVYAVGDIHGCYRLFRTLLTQIANDYPRRADGRCPVLILLGDYVDRGPDSAKVLEALVWLKPRVDIQVHLLKGNHEQAFLAFIESPENGSAWLEFGGAETLMSYGVPPPRPEEGPKGLFRARDDLVAQMPASHLRLLGALDLMVIVGDYVFVHAGIHPSRPLARQRESDLLWIREPFLTKTGRFEKVVVHGHTWTDERPQLLDHRLALDTGAYATGALTAAVLDGGEVRILQARTSDIPAC